MKTIFLSILLLALSCSSPPKTTTKTTTPKKEIKTETKVEEVMETPKIAEKQELLLVLKNIDSEEDVKALITNSGLTWDKLLYNKNASKIALIKVPKDKSGIWIERLNKSGEFKTVVLNDKKTLKKITDNIESSLVSLRKTLCYGHCPVFEVNIDKQGNVFYNGIKNVLVMGKREFKLTNKQFVKLKSILNKTSFSKYKSSYNNPRVMDLPSTYITYDKKEIQLRVWGEVPTELAIATEHIEDILLAKKFYEL